MPKKERAKIVKKLILLPSALFLGVLMFPAIQYGMRNVYIDNYTTCKLVPIDIATFFSFSCLMILLLLLIPIVFNRVRSAVYIKLYGAISLLFFGLWFLLTGYAILLCQPMHFSEVIFQPSIITMLVAIPFIFFGYQRKRLHEIINLNPHVFDFKTMRYHYLGYIKRPDGKDAKHAGKYMVLAGATGVVISRVVSYETVTIQFNTSVDAYMDLFGLFCMWISGYFIAGYLAVGEMYQAWIIYARSKKMNKQMVVKEFV